MEVNKSVKDHSWHEQLPSWLASEVLIEQSAADIKTTSGKLGIPRLEVPTPGNLVMEVNSTHGSPWAFEGLRFSDTSQGCRTVHVHLPKQT